MIISPGSCNDSFCNVGLLQGIAGNRNFLDLVQQRTIADIQRACSLSAIQLMRLKHAKNDFSLGFVKSITSGTEEKGSSGCFITHVFFLPQHDIALCHIFKLSDVPWPMV